MTVENINELKSIVAPLTKTIYHVLGYYTMGDGGGGDFYWHSNATDVDNGGTILSPDSSLGLNGRWKRSYDGVLNIRWFGAKGYGGIDDTIALQKALDTASVLKCKVILPNNNGVYTITDTLLVKSNTTIEFQAFVKLISSSTKGSAVSVFSGDVNVKTENVTIINPLIDCNDLGYPTSAQYGENGLSGSKCENVSIIGGHIKNCRRGIMDYGGKAIQFETGVGNINASGTIIEGCTTALETQGIINDGTNIRSNTLVSYNDIIARNCDRLIRCIQTFSPFNTGVEVQSVAINNITAYNCGRESLGVAPKNLGIIIFDRAVNVSLSNIVVYNDAAYGAVNSLFRSNRAINCQLKHISLYGDCDYIINLQRPESYGSTVNFSGNIIDSVNHYGTCGYVLEGQAGDNANLIKSQFKNVVTGVIVNGIVGINIAGNTALYLGVSDITGFKSVLGTPKTIHDGGNVLP